MSDKQSLDDIRRQIQESLIQAKRERLREQHDMLSEYVEPQLSPEAHNEWLDYILEFERQFENAQTIAVRERIGDPHLTPVAELAPGSLDHALDDLLELLAANGIVVDFLGDWSAQAAYRYITESLLDEEMDDIRIDGMFCHFDAATPEYDVEMWVEQFVVDVFRQERKYFLPGLEAQPFFDGAGNAVPTTELVQQLEAVWARLPVTRAAVDPLRTRVVDNEGEVTAVITWLEGTQQRQVSSSFRLQPCPYSGWDVVQTSLLEDLLAVL